MRARWLQYRLFVLRFAFTIFDFLGVHEKQIGTRLEYRSPEYLALEKAEKEWKASPRLVPTYFPRPSGDELEAN